MSRFQFFRLWLLLAFCTLPSCRQVPRQGVELTTGDPSAAQTKTLESRHAANAIPPDDSRDATVAHEETAPAEGWGGPEKAAALLTVAESGSDQPQLLPRSEDPKEQPALAPAPTDRASISIAHLEQMALEHNPTLRQSAWAVDKAAGIHTQVGLYPNPTVGYQGQEIGNDGAAGQQGAFLQQTIVLGDKLRLNRDVIGQDVQALSWANEAQRLRVLTDLRVSYFEALGAQRRVEVAGELVKLAEQGVETAKELFNAKQGAKPDILQAEILLNEVLIIRQNAQNDYNAAWRRLAGVVGLPDLAGVHLEGDLQGAVRERELDADYAELLASSPELQVAYASVARAQANLERQQVQPIPNLITQLGVARDNATGDDIASVQLGVPLPLFNKNQGNINAAHAEYCRASQEVERVRLALRVRLNNAFRDYVNASNQVSRIENDILPRADENRNLTEEAYRLGEFDFLRVLTARRTYFESNLRYVQALTELRQADALIEGLLLTGGLEAPADFEGDAGLRGEALSGQ